MFLRPNMRQVLDQFARDYDELMIRSARYLLDKWQVSPDLSEQAIGMIRTHTHTDKTAVQWAINRQYGLLAAVRFTRDCEKGF